MLYAVAFSASQENSTGVSVVTDSGYVSKHDERLAREKAMKMCFDHFPTSEGYSNHGVSLCAIPHGLIQHHAQDTDYDPDITVSDIWRE